MRILRRAWKPEPGPHGHGECLVNRRNGRARILAPPGVPLAPPEPIRTLLTWRLATYAHGRPLGPPRPLSFEQALHLVPSRRRWIRRCAREQFEREQAVRRLAVQRPSRRLPATPAGDLARRSPLAKTCSASTFAAYVGSSRDEAPIKLVACAVNSSRRFSDLLDALRQIEVEIEHDQMMQAVAALAHARARSHSWRYTWFVPGTARNRGERRIGREIRRARTGQQLAQALMQMEAADGHDPSTLDELLCRVLFRRSRSLRWRLTGPLRKTLARPRFHGARMVLRKQVRPGLLAYVRGARELLGEGSLPRPEGRPAALGE
ncbi:MAG TPA: hypothetical protein VID70_10645 [Solirubrobacteraceae bacterium]